MLGLRCEVDIHYICNSLTSICARTHIRRILLEAVNWRQCMKISEWKLWNISMIHLSQYEQNIFLTAATNTIIIIIIITIQWQDVKRIWKGTKKFASNCHWTEIDKPQVSAQSCIYQNDIYSRRTIYFHLLLKQSNGGNKF